MNNIQLSFIVIILTILGILNTSLQVKHHYEIKNLTKTIEKVEKKLDEQEIEEDAPKGVMIGWKPFYKDNYSIYEWKRILYLKNRYESKLSPYPNVPEYDDICDLDSEFYSFREQIIRILNKKQMDYLINNDI